MRDTSSIGHSPDTLEEAIETIRRAMERPTGCSCHFSGVTWRDDLGALTREVLPFLAARGLFVVVRVLPGGYGAAFRRAEEIRRRSHALESWGYLEKVGPTPNAAILLAASAAL